MRYLPLSAEERQKVFDACGVRDFGAFVEQVPENLRLRNLLDIEPSLSEPELASHLNALAERCEGGRMQSHLGQGVYDHEWPAVIDQIVNRGEFLTAYTPYQPELSQGTLQVIFEFQSMIAELLGTEVSNASLYDGPTAVVEGVLMAARLQGKGSGTVYVSEGTYPRTRELLETYLKPIGFKIETWKANPKTFTLDASSPLKDGAEPPVAFVAQSPNRWGLIEDWSALKSRAAQAGTKSVAYVAHAHSLAIHAAPGESGVDIVVGEAQTLGIPVGFGGPHLGILGCRKSDVRQMPGRLVGMTTDLNNERAFCVTLSTREQHIRREKATSNICSNQNLMATRAALYMTLMGPEGLSRVANLSRAKAYYARQAIETAFKGCQLRCLEGELFNEVTLLAPPTESTWVDEALARAEDEGVLAGVRVDVPKASGSLHGLTMAFTERHSKADIDRLVAILAGTSRKGGPR